MENRKTNTLLKIILVCASLGLAFGSGIYVTSLLAPKADTVQNETEEEKEKTDVNIDEGSVSAENDPAENNTDEFELPIEDTETAEEEQNDTEEFTVSSDDQEVDISGYKPVETPESVSSDPDSSDPDTQPSPSETAEEEDDELPEIPVFIAP